MLHENIKKLMEGFRTTRIRWAIFLSIVGAMSGFYPDAKDIFNKDVAPQADAPGDRQGSQHRGVGLPSP